MCVDQLKQLENPPTHIYLPYENTGKVSMEATSLQLSPMGLVASYVQPSQRKGPECCLGRVAQVNSL